MLKQIIFLQIITHSLAGFLPTTTIILDEATITVNPDYFTDINTEVKNSHTSYATITCSYVAVKTIPSTVQVLVQLMQFKNGDYELYGRNLTHDYCDYVKNDKLFMPSVKKAGNFTEGCPQPPGKYILKDYKLPLETFPAVLPNGKWKFVFYMTLQKLVLLQSDTYFQLVQGKM